MPATPEIGDVVRRVWHVEIRRQLDAQQQSRPNGDIGVTGKVVVQLQRVRVHRDQILRAGVEIRKIEYAIDQVPAQVVGDHQLLDQPQSDEKQRATTLSRF